MDLDAPAGQKLLGDASRQGKGGGEPGGGMAAAPDVAIALMADKVGIVPMAGPGEEAVFQILLGLGVAVFKDGAEGGAAGDPIHQAGQDVGDVPLLALGGIPSPRGAAGEEGFQFPQVDGFAGGQGSMTTPTASPWDSPNKVTLMELPMVDDMTYAS